MRITLRGKNIEITEAIEEKVSEKLSKLDKYFIVSENVEAKVLVRTYPYGQKIEVTIPTEYVLLRAEVVDQDLYNAIDLVIDKLEGQIRKYKTRLNRKSKDNKLAFNLASIEPLEDEEEDVLVKTKTITPKPMDMEEAIMQMELIGHSFFVYRDTETAFCVIEDAFFNLFPGNGWKTVSFCEFSWYNKKVLVSFLKEKGSQGSCRKKADSVEPDPKAPVL